MPTALQVNLHTEPNWSFRVTLAQDITDDQLRDCAALFSAHYGVWSEWAPYMTGPWAVPGNNIKMNVARLRRECLPESANNSLATAVAPDGRQVGHCLMSQWEDHGDRIWWITQLVVHPRFRNQKVATTMLSRLRSHHQIGESPPTADLVGILSSHPFSIRSVLRIFGRGIQSLATSLGRDRIPMNLQHAPHREAECLRILKSSPVDYVRNARLNPESESISADTQFFIDHSVPRQALQLTEDMMQSRWYFGPLPEGSEYICVLKCSFDKTRLEELFSKTIPVENRREMKGPQRPRRGPSSIEIGSSDSVSANVQTETKPRKCPADMEPPPRAKSTISDHSQLTPSYIELYTHMIGGWTMISKTLGDTMSIQINSAHKLITEDGNDVRRFTDSEAVPEKIWLLYWQIFCERNSEALGLRTEQPMSWYYLKTCAQILFPRNHPELCRLDMLQAIAFMEIMGGRACGKSPTQYFDPTRPLPPPRRHPSLSGDNVDFAPSERLTHVELAHLAYLKSKKDTPHGKSPGGVELAKYSVPLDSEPPRWTPSLMQILYNAETIPIKRRRLNPVSDQATSAKLGTSESPPPTTPSLRSKVSQEVEQAQEYTQIWVQKSERQPDPPFKDTIKYFWVLETVPLHWVEPEYRWRTFPLYSDQVLLSEDDDDDSMWYEDSDDDGACTSEYMETGFGNRD